MTGGRRAVGHAGGVLVLASLLAVVATGFWPAAAAGRPDRPTIPRPVASLHAACRRVSGSGARRDTAVTLLASRVGVDLATGSVRELPDAIRALWPTDIATAPGGRSIAFVMRDRDAGRDHVTVAALDGSRTCVVSGPVADARDPAWSPDGRRIVYASGRRLRVLDVRTGRTTTVRGIVGGHLSAPSFRSDGRAIIVTRTMVDSGRSVLMSVPAAGGTPRLLIVDAVGGAWSPDGSRIAYRPTGPSQDGWYRVGGVWLADADGRRGRRLGGTRSFVRPAAIAAHAAAARPRWSPDGIRIAYADGRAATSFDDGRLAIHVLDVESGNAISIGTGAGPSWSSGRSLIVERFTGRRARAIDARPLVEIEAEPAMLSRAAVSLTRDEARQLPAPLRGDGAHAFKVSPDGSRVVFVTGYESLGTRRVMVAALDGTGLRSVGAADREGYDADWTPDGAQVVYIDGGRLAVADVAGGRPTPIAGVRGRIRMPSVRPDGRTILYTRFAHHGERPELWVVPMSGGRARRLLRAAAYGAWSPDGRSIAFRRLRAAVASSAFPYDAGVWVARADGLRARRVWRGDGCCYMAPVDWSAARPAWAPDGSRLVMSQAPIGLRSRVVVVDVVGGRAISVGTGYLPTWSGDDTLIVQDYEAAASR